MKDIFMQIGSNLNYGPFFMGLFWQGTWVFILGNPLGAV